MRPAGVEQRRLSARRIAAFATVSAASAAVVSKITGLPV
jgi:hypothetical protein